MSYEIRDINGIPYCKFGKDVPKFNISRQTEYLLYCQFIALIKEACEEGKNDHPCLIGYLSSEEMNRRFVNNDPKLIGEDENNSADFIIVNNDIVVLFNHFSIDASKQIYKKEKFRGTEYQKLIGANKEKDLEWIAKEAVKIQYAEKYWIENLHDSYKKHEKKIPDYMKNADNYFLNSTNPNSSIDLKKTREMWFFIEDRTPYSYSAPISLFKALAFLLESNKEVNGVFYVRNGNPLDIPRDYHNCLVIHNDVTAIKGLKSGVVGYKY